MAGIYSLPWRKSKATPIQKWEERKQVKKRRRKKINESFGSPGNGSLPARRTWFVDSVRASIRSARRRRRAVPPPRRTPPATAGGTTPAGTAPPARSRAASSTAAPTAAQTTPTATPHCCQRRFRSRAARPSSSASSASASSPESCSRPPSDSKDRSRLPEFTVSFLALQLQLHGLVLPSHEPFLSSGTATC
jgi:hypothetical protein